MGAGLVKEISIDPEIDSYGTFFGHNWSQQLAELIAETKIKEPFFALCVNWKAAANTHFMPWFMMKSIRAVLEGYLNNDEPIIDQAFRALSQRLPDEMGDSLSNMMRKKLAQVIRKIGEEWKQSKAHEIRSVDIIIRGWFAEFAGSEDASELRLSIWGAQRLCYGSLYHAYENFVTRCIGLARGDPDYRGFPTKTLVADAKSVFGDVLATYCLDDQFVKIAREVRHALAHRGGKVNEALTNCPHDVVILDENLQIMPKDNRKLFEELKQRVSKLVEKAITLPQIR